MHALLGEINPVNPDGQVLVNGTVAYVGQQPTILNATLRENILFGLPYDDIKYANPTIFDKLVIMVEFRYKEAVRVSALEPDLNQLRDGDETEIGERGLNLSGTTITLTANPSKFRVVFTMWIQVVKSREFL